MSDGKEVKDRTTPPKDCQYVTWCNDCEEAVTNEDAACVECGSLDLEYFIRESDHDRIVAELRAEVAGLKKTLVDIAIIDADLVSMSTKITHQEATIDELGAELAQEKAISHDLFDRMNLLIEDNRELKFNCNELRAEVERLSNGGFVPHTNSPETKQAIDKLVDDLENVGRLRETIATHVREAGVLKAVIDKLKEKLEEIRWSWANDAGRQCDNLAFEALAAIERAEGEKERE